MTAYRFDQIAANITVRVEPADTDLERYVGLEHLDPESLKLRRWGSPSDVIGQKLKFWKGDIIYGKRRAYQRKLAVADFDGICSAHAMVLRAKTEVCLPEFLPFFLQSDLFHNRALEISVGSLSPTINWGTLAKQEFPLPPVDEQRRIADLLWAADDVVETQSELIKNILITKKSKLRDLYAKHFDSESANISSLGEIGHWESGGTPSKSNSKYWENGIIPWVTPKDVKLSYLTDTEDHVTDFAISSGKATLHKPGTFVVVWRSGILRHSLPVARIDSDFIINQDMKAFKPKNNQVDSEYVRYFVESFDNDIRTRSVKSGTTVESIATSVFHNYQIPLPSILEQKKLVEIASQFDNALSVAFTKDKANRDLRRVFLNSYLGSPKDQ